MPVHPEPVEGTEPVEVPVRSYQGFDRLSPNGEGFVFCLFVFPIGLSLSKGRLSPNGVGFVFCLFVFPIVLSLSKGRLSPNGEGFVFCLFVFPIVLSLSKGRLSPNGVGGVAKWDDITVSESDRSKQAQTHPRSNPRPARGRA